MSTILSQIRRITHTAFISTLAAVGCFFQPHMAFGQETRILEQASPFAAGFAQVVVGERSWYIDTAGSYAFDQILPSDNGSTDATFFTVVKEHGRAAQSQAQPAKWGIIKNGLWVLAAEYDSIDTRSNEWKIWKDGKSTWCDTNGKYLAPLRFEDMGYLDGQHFDVRQGAKWGIYDNSKDSLSIPCIYDEFDYCGGCGQGSDYVLAAKNGKWGIVSFQNEIRVPFEYQHMHMNMRSDEWVMSFRLNDHSVLINMRTGKRFAEPQYQVVENPLWNNLVCVAKNKKWGLLTAEGQMVTPFEYDYITWFDEAEQRSSSYACVEKNGLYGLIDTTGKLIIPIRYSGLIWAYDDSTFFVNGKKEQILLDRRGNRLLPGIFQNINVLPVNADAPYLFEVTQNGKSGIYDRRTNRSSPRVYDKIDPYQIPHFILAEKKGRIALYNQQLREILPCRFEEINPFHDEADLLRVKEGGHEGLYDTSGKVVLAPLYDAITETDDHYFLLRRDTSYWSFNSQTAAIDSLPYPKVMEAGSGHLLLAGDQNEVRLYDPSTKTTRSEGYEFITSFHGQAVAIAQKNGKQGLIDENGKAISPFIYTDITGFNKGLAAVQNDSNKYGFVDSTGRVIISMLYDKPATGQLSVEDFMQDDDLCLYRQDSTSGNLLKGIAHRDGRIVLQPDYDIIIKELSGKGYLVSHQGKFGVIGMNGQTIIPPIYENIQTDYIDRYRQVVRFSFPLLCNDGKTWKYLTATGETLPYSIHEIK